MVLRRISSPGSRLARFPGHRPQFELHLQGQGRGREAGEPGAGRPLRRGGKCSQGGERVRISAQLIDATTGAHVWAERTIASFGTSLQYRTRSPRRS